MHSMQPKNCGSINKRASTYNLKSRRRLIWYNLFVIVGVCNRLSWYQRAAINRGVTSVSGPHRHDVIAGLGDDVTRHVTLSRAVHRSRPASPPECTASSRGSKFELNLVLRCLLAGPMRMPDTYSYDMRCQFFPVSVSCCMRMGSFTG